MSVAEVCFARHLTRYKSSKKGLIFYTPSVPGTAWVVLVHDREPDFSCHGKVTLAS